MSKLDEALKLVSEWYEDTYASYDQDGDKYYDSTPKEWGRYHKIIDNLKAFGATEPLSEEGKRV